MKLNYHISMEKTEKGLYITSSLSSLLPQFICYFILGGIIIIFWIFLSFCFSIIDLYKIPPIIFPVICMLGILFIIPFLYFLYFFLVSSANKTVIEINNTELTISSRPLPWYSDRKFGNKDIKAIEVKEHTWNADDYGYEKYTDYNVYLILKNKTEVFLLKAENLQIAKTIKTRLENYLKLLPSSAHFLPEN